MTTTNTTTAAAISITLLLASSSARGGDADAWDGGFEEPADVDAAAKDGSTWKLSPEASLLVEAFRYVERAPDAPEMSSARFAFDARLRLEAKSDAAAARVTLLLRRDVGDSSRNRTDADEAYVDFGRGTTRLRIGRSLHRWGVSNIYKPSDFINPTDYSDFLEFEKRGSYSVWARRHVGSVFLEAFYLPVPEPDILPLPEGIDEDGTFLARNRWVRGALPAEADGMPIRYRLSSADGRPPSARNTQGALRASGTLRGYELSVGYAYLFDHVPTFVPHPTPMTDHIDVELRAVYRRRHMAVLGLARSFGKSRLALDLSLSVPRGLPASAPPVTVDNGFATGVLSFDHITRELRPNHTVQLAIDLTITQPLGDELPLDDVSRMRYPFPLAALARVSYHAGTQTHLHLEIIESFEGFGLGRLDANGGKAAFILQPRFERTVANDVQIELGATVMLGADSTLFGRFRHNTRFFWSANTTF